MAKNKKKDVMDLLDGLMSDDSKKKADKKADRIISIMKLADLRKETGLNQTDLKGFSQPQVSQIENRENVSTLQLSTLIDYLESLGFGIKVIGYSKENDSEEFELLKA